MKKIGEITIETIYELDASAVIRDTIKDATPENIKKLVWLVPYYADPDGNISAVNQSFLLRTPNGNIVIDTCVGNGRLRPELREWNNLQTEYLANLQKVIDPNDVDFVLCTHLHFDHIGWNTKHVEGRWVPTFPNATYVFSRKEFEYWMGHPEKELIDDLNGIDESIKPLVNLNMIKLVEDDARMTHEVRLVPTPGHTPHHISILIESGGKSALFAGDIFHHPCQIAKPEWLSFDTDGKTALDSRKQILQEYSDTGTIIFGAHFSAPYGGQIIKSGRTYKLKSLDFVA